VRAPTPIVAEHDTSVFNCRPPEFEVVQVRRRRNMPDPLPGIVRERLAVDESWAGRGVGGGPIKRRSTPNTVSSNRRYSR
jgi:hypothetical protein